MGLPLKDIHEKVSVHINDTHPAVAPAEFMRLLLDEYGLSWEDAWNATVKTMSYTNHTILQEALEKWDQQLFKRVLPRVYQIILEIDNRYIAEMAGRGIAADVIERTRIVKDGQVHMANLAIIGGHSVNGVANFIQNFLKKIPSTISILFILKNSITRQMVSFNVVGHKLQLQNFQQQLMT